MKIRLAMPLIVFCAGSLALGAQEPRLSTTSIGAVAGPSSLLTLPSAARISVLASSSTGVPISLHDKMEGEIARDGDEGSKNGRIDMTLDKGEYRVRLEASDPSVATAQLRLGAFREIGGDAPSSWPRLAPGVSASATLGDLQSASYWIELREDGAIEVEALGRDLATLEIWREGQYLIGSYPIREERQVETGKPMGYACASVEAKAGLYLARCYGGPERVWAKDDGKRPLYVRSGFIGIPIGGRLDLAISPFGRDFVLVDGADRAVLTRKAAGEASFASTAYSPGGDRLSSGDAASIAKDSADLSRAIRLPPGKAIIRVQAKPGEVFLIDAFRSLADASVDADDLRAGGLLTILSPRTSAPEIELTGLAYRVVTSAGVSRAVVAKDFCPALSGSAPIRRRCNIGLDGERSMYVRVEEAGDYIVAEKSGVGQAEGLYSMESLSLILEASGSSDQAPAKGAAFSLRKGYYRLTVSARSIGTLDFALARGGLGRNGREELAKEPPLARSSYSWAFDPDPSAKELLLKIGRGPSKGAGYSFARYPVDMGSGIVAELGPRDSLELSGSLSSPGIFRWTSRQGEALLDGRVPVEGSALARGQRRISLRNPSASPVSIAFSIAPSFDDLVAPKPSPFGSGMEGLVAGKPAWRDFARSDRITYAFEVKEPAVYVIETLGRLSTAMTLRTASRLRLFEASANGYGKNAAIRAWLRPGQYYAEVSTQGLSTGRGGVRLDRVALAAEAALAPGAVDRRSVPADSAASFSFALAAPERIDLRSTGLGGFFPVRLEDSDGFIAYRGEGRTSVALGAGTYRLFSLPVSIDTNRLTWIRLLRREPAAAPVTGTMGLALNAPHSALWKEGTTPDRYSFSVPSDLEARLDLPAAFGATLEGPDGKRSLDGKDRASFPLKKGDYSIAVRPRDKADQLYYSIQVSTSVLAPGVDGIAVPGEGSHEIAVSVPSDGFYELWSLGITDVAASLVRADGGEAAAISDDNGPDWNFDIVQRLKTGRYRLTVSSIAPSGQPVEVYLESRNARALPASQAPYEARLAMDEAGVLLPFDAKSGDGLYLVSASEETPVSLRLYNGEALLASGEGRIAIPLRSASRYSLYAWSPFAANPTLSIRRLQDKDVSISEAFSVESGGVARIRNSEGLSSRVSTGRLLVSPGLELPCADPGSAPFSTVKEGGWAWALGAASSTEPLRLGESEGTLLTLAQSDQGFTLSSRDKAMLVAVDTRGQFRCGISALPEAVAGAAPYDWDASSAWSQGSIALLPPGDWKARVWDGERSAGISRRIGAGMELLELRVLPAAAMGARTTLVVPAGKALAMDVPACTLSLLLGEGLVLSAWKDSEALASRSSLDGRTAETVSLKACRVFVANKSDRDASIRLAVLPARAASSDELSSAKAFETVSLPPEGLRLDAKVAEDERLCLAGDPFVAELETNDGRYQKVERRASDGLFTVLPATSGTLRIKSAAGLVRAYLAKPGKELDGLLAQDTSAARRDLKDAALLTGKGDAFRLVLNAPGYADISCPGPGFLALSGAGIDRRIAVSGSREDMHLFAWLPAGEYGLWQRPARGATLGGILRVDRVESREADAESLAGTAFIGAREYQAWTFEVLATSLVGAGIKADTDGLVGFLYDSRQGLLASGPLIFATLAPGAYVLVVKGLDDAPMEYALALDGLDGSRVGPPPDVIQSYKASSGVPASLPVPMRYRGAAKGASGGALAPDDEGGETDRGEVESGDGGDNGEGSDSGDGGDNNDDSEGYDGE